MTQLGERIGDYRLLAHLSKGRSSELYAVTNDALSNRDTLYAMKIHSPSADAELLCDRIIERCMPVAHPQIARTRAAFVHEGRLCVVMDYVEGESLAAVMRAEPEAFEGLLGIALAIEIASILDEVRPHGDLCPQHVMIGYDGKLTLLEYGLALAASTTRKDPAIVTGHFGYMSPERAAGGGDVDSASDVFSLGLIVWEMLARRPANKGSTDSERRSYAMKPKIEPLKIEGRINRAVNDTIMHALAEKKIERITSPETLAGLLKQLKNFKLQHFKRDTELETFMRRHFQVRARAARVLRERWKAQAAVRPARPESSVRLPVPPRAPSMSHAMPLPPIPRPMSSARIEARPLAELDIDIDLDSAVTDDLPSSGASADLPRPRRPLSFSEGLAIVMIVVGALTFSTVTWSPDARAAALRVGSAVNYGIDYVLTRIAGTAD
jgi:serine/threonine protein kinase